MDVNDDEVATAAANRRRQPRKKKKMIVAGVSEKADLEEAVGPGLDVEVRCLLAKAFMH